MCVTPRGGSNRRYIERMLSHCCAMLLQCCVVRMLYQHPVTVQTALH